MIEFEEACTRILENTHRLDIEERLIEDAAGYVLARDVVSSIDVAPFKNSAMDGFAVKSEWLAACSEKNPVALPIGATSFAGAGVSNAVPDRHAIKTMTGARVGDDFDAVVPFENTLHSDSEVTFSAPAKPGQHVRMPGEDIIRGRKLYAKGTGLGQLDIGILATVGLRSVPVYRKPTMRIVGTGDELIQPGEELTGDNIYDANTFTLQALVRSFCDAVERIYRVSDRKDELLKAIDSHHDVIVTSGGVSAGERDLVIRIAESCGWERIFHKARIKPGKPMYFARRGRQLMFGLPGNPLSATVTCSVFLIPALKKMSGWSEYRLRPEPAVLAAGESRKTGRKLIWPGFIREEDGGTVARFSPKKSSAAITALLDTDGLIIQDASETNPGEVSVEVLPWRHILQ